MSEKYIDNISREDLHRYFNGEMSGSEKERVKLFLLQYSALYKDFEEFSVTEIERILAISERVNAKVDNRIKKKLSFGVLALAAASILVLVGIFYFFDNRPAEIEEFAMYPKRQMKTSTIQDSVLLEAKLDKEEEDDTIFSFDKKGGKLEIESKVQKDVNTMNDIERSIKKPLSDNITEITIKELEKQLLNDSEIRIKSFISSIQYKQSVEIEEKFYGNEKASSFAAPVKGYTFDSSGMPSFGLSDKDVLNYINVQLKNEDLLIGITKKMRANLSFIVTNKGKIKDIQIQNCNHRQLGLALMEIMENMPDWNPSEFFGKKGKVHYVLKIVYE